jgi:hypothetical protein
MYHLELLTDALWEALAKLSENHTFISLLVVGLFHFNVLVNIKKAWQTCSTIVLILKAASNAT